jgi:hypothetical protein
MVLPERLVQTSSWLSPFHGIAGAMMAQGVGVRLSILVGLVSAAVSCASPGDGAGHEGSSDNRVGSNFGSDVRSDIGNVADRGNQPERVVQRMSPAVDRAGVTSGVTGATARNSIASGTLESDRASRANAESISPKHLEAELNRLEAEIGN